MTPGKPTLAGELLAEFLGTFVLIALGDGVVAMVVLFDPNVPGASAHGGYTNITLGWGLAVLMGLCVAGRVSGGHLNPAVTLALAVFRGFPWRKVLPYSAAQLAGGFAGAALVFINYLPAFHKFDPTLSHSVTVFATAPAFPDAWAYGLIDQVVGTALLVGLVLAIVEPKNRFTTAALQPLLIALVVVAIGISWGGMHGYAINPARDLGPRLFTLAAGFSNTGFTDGVFVVPIVGPLLGGLLGALVYDRLVRPFIPSQGEGNAT
jgi:glycerol uptake facilitator protein